MFGKSEPSTTRSASPTSRDDQSGGSGAKLSVKSAPTIVVSRYTRGYRSASRSAASYSGMPA